ncbi:hypothetical protein B0T10DRAFT_71258 [Thelonectria olida]|uniref:G domain-containing protein n=1 Tax=Thelonectria olida TaxID=1576542 RepID=A0A9P8W2E8_9HYPO|nr:hypothetical protein B0T10DRAFT_71258 [Thelonectria olida]
MADYPPSSPSVESSSESLILGTANQPNHGTDPRVFRDGRAPRSTDVFIAVMGVTGSGKSSFISHCCEKIAQVGHSLHACTTTVDVYAYELSPQQTVYLIDTPGFDDTNRSDTEVLREVASWLAESYKNKVLLHGIIYLHRITDPRMQGSAKKNLLMFKKLCGEDALRKVVLATTMWDELGANAALGNEREKELIDTPEFWGYMVSKGSRVHRHYNTADSAQRIIKELARGSLRVTLDLQDQMVNERRELIETGAGKEIEAELIEERKKWARELKDVRDQMEEAIQLKDMEAQQALKEVKDDYKGRIKRLEQQSQRLHVDSARLHQEQIENLKREMKEQQEKSSRAMKENLKRELKEQQDKHSKEMNELREQKDELERTGAQVLKQAMDVSEALTRANRSAMLAYEPAPASFARSRREFSLSLAGDFFALEGPNMFYQNCFPPSSREMMKPVMKALCFFVCGTNGSWIYKYETAEGGSYLIWSDNMDDEYPSLENDLEIRGSTSDLIFITLGPKGTFFAQWDSRYSFKLPSHIKETFRETKRHGGFKGMTLGIDETYVIVYGHGCTWELGDHYDGLERKLQRSTPPKAVALNSQNGSDFLVLRSTLAYRVSGPLRGHSNPKFVEWTDAHGVSPW